MKLKLLLTLAALTAATYGVELTNDAKFGLYDAPEELTCKLAKGATVQFTVGENGTTGYRWEAKWNAEEADVVLKHCAAKPKTAEGVPIVGAPGCVVVKVTLKRDAAAPVEIKLLSRRPWEKDKPPAKTIRLVCNPKPSAS